MELKLVVIEVYNMVLWVVMLNIVWIIGCDSWYLNKDGIFEVWLFVLVKYCVMFVNLYFEEYDL